MNKIVTLMFALIIAVDASINITGDVEIIGMFQIHEMDSKKCGQSIKLRSVMVSEAVKWYIQQLNLDAGLPVSIGFRAVETCRLVEKAAEHAVHVMDTVLNNDSNIIGIVGPEYSSEAEVVSPIFSSVTNKFRVAQVGFSTTAASLSDKKRYPNVFSVIPNDAIQIETMVRAMVRLKWNRVVVIFEEDIYGRGAFELLKQRAMQENICISISKGFLINNGINSTEILNVLTDIIIGNVSRPPINGIVFIGESSIAKTIFITLQKLQYATVPIMMLSEGFGMDTKAVQELPGGAISKVKGSLALSPPYIEVVEFQDHWKDIFTNESTFQKESSTNSWIKEVYYDIKHCSLNDCSFKALSESEFNSVFGKQPLYLQYAIVAAHALVKAMITVHANICSNQNNCSTFRQTFRPGDILNELKRININMKTDFKFGLDSLENLTHDSLMESTDETTQIAQSKTASRYQIFNFRKTENNPEIYDFIKIGDLLENELRIDLDAIRDYDNQGFEKYWPEVRIPQCVVHTICSECISLKEKFESIIHDPGDLYIVGVVPVYDSAGIDGCGNIRTISGYQTAESIRFAADKVNQKLGDYFNIFQGMKIGTIILNSCNNPVVIQRKIYDIHKYGIKLQNGTSIDLTNRLLGFVGDIGSSISISVAEVLSKLNHVQISFASTSPALSDRQRYPYFMRVVTPDDAQAKAILEVIKQLKANFVQMIYSVGAYGDGIRNKIKETAHVHRICLINEIPIKENENAFAVYEELRKYKHAQIVIVVLGSHRIQPVISALTSIVEKGEFIFLGSETWATKSEVLQVDENQVLLGSFTMSLEMHQNNELRTHIQNLKTQPNTTNPWLMSYLQAKYKCYFNDSFDKTENKLCVDGFESPEFTLDSWDTAAFVAAKSLLFGASSFFRLTCGSSIHRLCADFKSNTKGLVEEMLKTRHDLDGSGNTMKVFNQNGDGNIGYKIYNIQKDEDNPLKLVYKEVGRFPLEGTFTFEEKSIVYPRDTPVISTCPNEQACETCFSKSDSEKLQPGEISQTIDSKFLGLSVGLGLAVIVIVVLSSFIIVGRKKKNRQNTDSGIYITPTVSGDVFCGTRQEAVGSAGSIDTHSCRSFTKERHFYRSDHENSVETRT